MQVICYLGPVTYSSDISVIYATDTSFVVSSLQESAVSATSFTISWTAPIVGVVTGYRVWVTIDSDHNGYAASSNATLLFELELRDPSLLHRLVVSPGTTSATFSGCYLAANNVTHCISPYTLYQVYVSPLSTGEDGFPLSVLIKTSDTAPVAPVNFGVVCN